MQDIDLKGFRECNNLLQKTIADYLGVTRAYLSQVENNKCELSHQKVRALLENDRGWDISMLVKDRSVKQEIGDNSSNNTQIIGTDNQSLLDKISMLEKLLEEKERTIQILLNR